MHSISKEDENYSRRDLQIRSTRLLLNTDITPLSSHSLTHSHSQHSRNSHTDRIAHPQVLAVVSDRRVPRVQLGKGVVVLRFDLRARVATGNGVVRFTVRRDA